MLVRKYFNGLHYIGRITHPWPTATLAIIIIIFISHMVYMMNDTINR